MQKFIALIATALSLGAQAVGAATIIPVSGSTADVVGGGAVPNVIDGVVDFDSYLAIGPVAGPGTFTGPYTVTFDLGGDFTISAMNLWNNGGFIELDGEGINAFSLVFRDATTSTTGGFNGNAADLLAQQAFEFPAVNAAFVDLIVSSNHLPSTRTYAVFHEINFEGVATVPVPASFWLLGTAIGVAARFGVRRRRVGRQDLLS